MGALEIVLDWVVNGVELKLGGISVEDGRVFLAIEDQQLWIKTKIACMLLVQAIEYMGLGERPVGVWFCLPVFLVPKKGPKKWQLEIDLCRLNIVLKTYYFKFKTLGTLARLVGRGWWMIMFNLVQGYYHIRMLEMASCYMGFQIGNDWYCYRVLPFSLKWLPGIFMKIT